MQDIHGLARNGYILRDMDLRVHARTVDNQIITLDVQPEGTKGYYGNEEVILPHELATTDSVKVLLNRLLYTGIKLQGNQLILVNDQKELKASKAVLRDSEPCSQDVSPCKVNTCPGFLCGANASPCAGNRR